MNKTWKDCGRDDLNMIPTMEAAGWNVIFQDPDKRYERTNPDNPPHDEVMFNKGNTWLWKVRDWKSGNHAWQTCVRYEEDSVLRDYKRYATLEDVLAGNELKK